MVIRMSDKEVDYEKVAKDLAEFVKKLSKQLVQERINHQIDVIESQLKLLEVWYPHMPSELQESIKPNLDAIKEEYDRLKPILCDEYENVPKTYQND